MNAYTPYIVISYRLLCETHYALDLTDHDEDHEDRSEPLDAETLYYKVKNYDLAISSSRYCGSLGLPLSKKMMS